MLRFCLNRGLERQVGTESLLRSLIALWRACTDLKRGCFRCVPPIFGNLWLLGCSNDNSPLRSCYQGPIVDDVRSLVGFHLEETPIAAESLGGVQWNRFWVYIHRKPSTMPPYWRQCQLSRRAKMSVSGSTQDCRWPPRTPTDPPWKEGGRYSETVVTARARQEWRQQVGNLSLVPYDGER